MARNAVSFSGAHPMWLVDLQWYSKQMGGGMTTEMGKNWEVIQSKDDPMGSEWRAEYIDSEHEGECYVTIFSGPSAKERAREYVTFYQRLEAAKARGATLREQVLNLRTALVEAAIPLEALQIANCPSLAPAMKRGIAQGLRRIANALAATEAESGASQSSINSRPTRQKVRGPDFGLEHENRIGELLESCKRIL